MKYDLSVRKHNVPAHLDIENDIAKKKNGQFTFTIRVNNGNIVDYNVTEVVDIRSKYFSRQQVIVEEFIASYTAGKRSQ